MGVMIDGVYHAQDPAPQTSLDGTFQRQRSSIRDWISDPDPARYHLFVAWNCPWAHRALLARGLLGLSDITLSVCLPKRSDQGWVFDPDGPYSDPLFGLRALHEIYAKSGNYTGRVTVPVLWDKKSGTPISNESADILRMLGEVFGHATLTPAPLLDQIEAWNARIYKDVNNGVYRAGFARTQEAYDVAVREVFQALDEIEVHLATHRYLCGDRFTEADIRLFPTLARFDVAYHGAFKCNLRRLIDYPHLWAYAREIYAMPGVAETVRFDIYKQGYFSASELRNPTGIVPIGPQINWHAPHGRAAMS